MKRGDGDCVYLLHMDRLIFSVPNEDFRHGTGTMHACHATYVYSCSSRKASIYFARCCLRHLPLTVATSFTGRESLTVKEKNEVYCFETFIMHTPLKSYI